MSELFDFSDGNGLVPAHRHINPDGSIGGWVADTAWVSRTARVGRNAQIFGKAWVYGNAWVYDYARVCGDAWVYGRFVQSAGLQSAPPHLQLKLKRGGSPVNSEEIITVWKATKANGQPMYGRTALPQPVNGKPGAWHDVGCHPIPCAVGVHGSRTLADMLRGGWLDEELNVAQLRGPFIDSHNKVVARSGRLCYKVNAWNEQTARLFAADCAEMVAHLHPIIEPTVRVVRRYAFGLASVEDLAAARGVAWAAVGAAAAEGAAALAAGAAEAAAANEAWGAVVAAAQDAADAAGAAEGTAAKDAVYERMALRLHDYLRDKVDIEAIRKSVE